MGIENYLLFLCAGIVLCVTPGPDMIYLLGRTLAQGKQAGVAAVVGINLGGYFHLLAAVIGISALIAASATAFTVLKWCGALYLVYLGVQALRSGGVVPTLNKTDSANVTYRTILWQGFVSDVLNPKVVVFFVSLLPQFIVPDAGNPTIQLLVLGVSLNIIALIINLLLVLFAESVIERLGARKTLASVLNKLLGGIFIGLGIRLAALQR